MQKKRFTEGYKFKGFKAYSTTIEHSDDPEAIIIKMKRIKKKQIVNYVE